MAKQKFRPTRLGVFSGAKAYIQYVEVLKKCRNAGGRTFCDAIKINRSWRYRINSFYNNINGRHSESVFIIATHTPGLEPTSGITSKFVLNKMTPQVVRPWWSNFLPGHLLSFANASNTVHGN
jgi:hypothetical protein